MTKWEQLCKALRHGGFVINDLFPIIAAVYVTRRWKDEPLWILSVGPPGTGKSVSQKLFSKLTDVKLVSSLTPAGLISGWGGDELDRSLLAELDGKTLMAKDFGTILHMNWTAANEVFSYLRESFDGYVKKQFGNCVREYTLKFNMVAAATDVYEQFRTFQQQLGERFLRFSINPIDLPSPPPSINDALMGHVAGWMTEVERIKQPQLTEGNEQWIHLIAKLVAKLRTEVVHSGHSHEIVEIPGFEGPARLEKQLTKLFQGLTLIEVGKGTRRRLVKHTALSCVSPRRSKILRLLAASDKPLIQTDMAETLKLGYGVVRRATNDMYALGFLKRADIEFPKAFYWEISDTFVKELALLIPEETNGVF